MTTTKVKLDDITIDAATQQRVCVDTSPAIDAVVAEYFQSLTDGCRFPPIILYTDGTTTWMADGHLRYRAYRRLGVIEVAADVRKGSLRDAILHSVGANASHGLRRTNADKRRAVTTLLKDAEWGQWSNRMIAEKCGVSDMLVGTVKDQLQDSCGSPPPAKTKGRDGKLRKPKSRAELAKARKARIAKLFVPPITAADPQDVVVEPAEEEALLAAVEPPVHVVVTDDSEWSRRRRHVLAFTGPDAYWQLCIDDAVVEIERDFPDLEPENQVALCARLRALADRIESMADVPA